MKKIIARAVFFLVLIVLTLSFSINSYAAGDEEPTATPTPEEETNGGVPVYGGTTVYGGEPVYGGGVIEPKPGELLVDKMVLNPATGVFVDHLDPTHPKYRPLNIITFQIKVENSGEEILDEINLIDSLPDFVDFMSGPGNYNQDERKLTFTVNDLGAGTSEIFEIKARVSHQATLPEEKNVICPVNVVEAKTGDRLEKDESQFCIEKEMEVTEVPKAGAQEWILALAGSALATGIYLRKKAFQS